MSVICTRDYALTVSSGVKQSSFVQPITGDGTSNLPTRAPGTTDPFSFRITINKAGFPPITEGNVSIFEDGVLKLTTAVTNPINYAITPEMLSNINTHHILINYLGTVNFSPVSRNFTMVVRPYFLLSDMVGMEAGQHFIEVWSGPYPGFPSGAQFNGTAGATILPPSGPFPWSVVSTEPSQWQKSDGIVSPIGQYTLVSGSSAPGNPINTTGPF